MLNAYLLGSTSVEDLSSSSPRSLQEALKCLSELKKCTFTYLNQTLHKHFWHFSKHSQTYPSVFSRVMRRFPPELYR
ncbi:hypothetical protein PRUPE_1G553000 [Prunus persica]|uniref:Uncharacterized protein n=1 Tax=Prunus persica TaxID=3760 RepID=A0A251RIF9_PRUPE|nr:hypothetical protein PRUPE_1G553000 [Prunus persica]